MAYEVIASTNCGGGNCPTVRVCPDMGDDVLIQGYTVPAEDLAGLGIPAGETVIRVPMSLLRDAVGHG